LSLKIKSSIFFNFIPAIFFLTYFIVVIYFRPLIPIAETRYVAVAWEMFLNKNFLSTLTLNFDPYHHKPPLLFWLINIFWIIFGVNKFAATIPTFIFSILFIFFSRILAKKLFPDTKLVYRLVPLLTIGSLPFIIYGTVIMFDVALGAITLLAIILFFKFLDNNNYKTSIAIGFLVGLGILMKGPVSLLYTLVVIVFSKFWIGKKNYSVNIYIGFVVIIFVSLIPPILWLIPILQESSDQFAYFLIWKQTVGRITGDFEDANTHARPFWFYFPLLILFVLPWFFLPKFLKNLFFLRNQLNNHSIKFLLFWILPLILIFSLIKGKQAHYLIPILPGIIILISYLVYNSYKIVFYISNFLLGSLILIHLTIPEKIFKNFDTRIVADIIKKNGDKPIAFYGKKYQGELTFYANITRKIDNLDHKNVGEWLKKNKNGIVITVLSINDPTFNVNKYKILAQTRYRGSIMSLISNY